MVTESKKEKGFSGLADLASEIPVSDNPATPGSEDNDKKCVSGPSDLPSGNSTTPKTKEEAKPTSNNASPPHQGEVATSNPLSKSTNSSPPVKTASSGKNSNSSVGGWFLGIAGIFILLLIVSSSGNDKNKSSYNSPSSTQSASYPKEDGGQYTKPSPGINNKLYASNIRWCLREEIRIEAMRNIPTTEQGINKFNDIVNDFNTRCSNYRYKPSSLSQAQQDVEKIRYQIVSDAIREAKKFDYSYQSPPQTSYQSAQKPTYQAASQPVVHYLSSTATAVPVKPSRQEILTAQRLLSEMGYNPGPIDGIYGRRTVLAIKQFQDDIRKDQDGCINQELLSLLEKAKTILIARAARIRKEKTNRIVIHCGEGFFSTPEGGCAPK